MDYLRARSFAARHFAARSLSGIGALVQAAAGWLRRKFKRTVLVTIKGARFQVPEDELEAFLEAHAEKLVAEVVKPVIKPVKASKQDSKAIPEPPQIVVETDTGWILDLVRQANEVIAARFREKRKQQEDEDILILLLAA